MAISFDGNNKIIALSGLTTFNFHDDVYVPAINWMSLPTNMKYVAPISGSGKQPISSGVYTDSIFTILNGWKLQLNGYTALQIIKIIGTVTNGQDSLIEEAYGACPVITFAGYTNATIVTTGSGLSTEEHNALMGLPPAVNTVKNLTAAGL